MGLEGFRLLSCSVVTAVEGICVFLSVAGDRRCARVFELLVHLGIGARSAVLPRGLYCRNLLLSEGPSCLKATAFHGVFIKFPLGHYEIFKGGIVDIKDVNK